MPELPIQGIDHKLHAGFSALVAVQPKIIGFTKKPADGPITLFSNQFTISADSFII
jgi:hypothetical protein